MKYIIKVLFLLPLFITFVSCQTKSQTVETLAFKKLPNTKVKNTFKSDFAKRIVGTYLTEGDEQEFTVDIDGSFKIGETSYTLHDAVSPYQGIYVAATPVPDSYKKLYTYHGLIITSNTIQSAPYKMPTYEKTREISKKESEYAWELNVFRIENINWQSGFTTVFAIKK